VESILEHTHRALIRQIQTWDTHVIPISKALDPLLGYTLGRSIIGVWTRRA